MANLLSTNVTGTLNSTGNTTAAGFTGNANVGGTGSATWHPSGIYCGSTMWQYGSQYKNNTGIYDVSELKINAGANLSMYNTRNLIVKAHDSNDVMGILGQKSGGGFAFQLYGDGTNYGFLNGTWAAWDLRKTVNGALYMNDNTTYYLRTDSTSYLYQLSVNTNLYLDNNYGSSIVGAYSSTRYQGVFAMGDSYKLALDGTSPGSLYGIAWTHTNVGGESKAGLGHQALFMMNGRTYTAIGSGIWTDGTITTTSHGTSANWNTAYGWGNHAGLYLGISAKAADSELIDGIDSTRIVYGGGASKVSSHSNANDWRDSGFYENDGGGSNWPSATWYNSINVRHSNQGNYHGFQIAMSYYDNNLWFRSYQGSGVFQSWAYAISSANIGSQSVSYASSAGNADTVDSYHASNFIGKNGNSYFQLTTWLQSTGTHGIYAPSSGSGTHWYPGTNATYGTWIMEGMRNNYQGVQFYNTAGPIVVMYDSSGNGGAYNHSDWHFYWNNGNKCLGVNGSGTSSSYALYVNTKGIYTDGDVVAFSDRRKKADIVTIDNALEKVSQMRGVYYTRIDDENGPRKTGVIAQEMNEILPEVVTYAADTDEYGVSYGNIVGVLIEAIKEQQKQIDDLKKRLGE